MLYDAKELTLHLGPVEMDYIAFGTGTRPLILIQGLNTRGIRGAAYSLAWMYRSFARRYRVYLFDRRNRIPEGITVRELASDLALAMDALGLRDAHVLGVSQGGMIAQYLAMERPDLVNRLVLAVTLSRNNETVETVIRTWTDLAERGAWKTLTADMARKLYSEAYLKRYRLLMPLLTVLQTPKDVQRFIRLAQACLTCSTYEQLDRITCPVLVIGGQQDQIVTAAASEELAERLNCGLVLYEELGHGAYEEAADFNQRVLEFFGAS